MQRVPSLLSLAVAALLPLSAHANTSVELTGGRLHLITPNGDQNLKIEVGPGPGSARVFGFPGLADGTEYFDVMGITLITGAGRDSVEFDIEAAQDLDVRVDTQGGEALAKVIWDIRPVDPAGTTAASLSLAATGGTLSSAVVDVLSDADKALVSIDTGTAAEVSGKVISPNASEFLGVSFRSAAAKTSFEVGSGASALELDVVGGQAAATNELSYVISTSVPRAAVLANWSIQTGSRPDKVEAKIAAPGSDVTHRGSIDVRGGNDFVLVETDAFRTVTGLVLRGEAGSDALAQIIKGRFQASQALQARMIGGAGDDELILTTDTGIFGTGLPNDLFPVINCGDGADRYNAFGRIVSCETRL